MRSYLHTVTEADIGKRFLKVGTTTYWIGDAFGSIQAIDVGKRIYQVPTDDGTRHILQMENDEQRDQRLAKERT